MTEFENDKDGVKVLWEYKAGWLVYEYTGFVKDMYPAKRAWVGHRCINAIQHQSNGSVGFVSSEMQGKNICGWCDTVIPDEVHGVVTLFNYGEEGERYDEG